MLDTINEVYEEMIHCAILTRYLGSVDVAVLFYINGHNGHNLLRMGLAETWAITRTSVYGASKTILTY